VQALHRAFNGVFIGILLLGTATQASAQSCNYPITLSSSGICPGDSVLASTNQNTFAWYTWSLNGNIIATGTTSSIYVSGTGTLSLTVLAPFCFTSSSVTIQSFTPTAPDLKIQGPGVVDTTLANGTIHAFKCTGNGQFSFVLNNTPNSYSSWDLNFGNGNSLSGTGNYGGTKFNTYSPGTHNGSITLTNSNGCDSTISFSIFYGSDFSDTLVLQGCDSVQAHGQNWTTSGLYAQNYATTLQCDSIWYYDITIGNTQIINSSMSSCEAMVWEGLIVDTTGVYQKLYTSSTGCDSLLTLNFTRFTSYRDTFQVTGCGQASLHGLSWNNSGVYSITNFSVDGCDSIQVYNVVVNPLDTTYSYGSGCDSVMAFGVWRFSSGTYSEVYSSTSGCDSVHQVVLTISNSYLDTIAVEGCSAQVLSGIFMDTTGVYMYTGSTSAGCDSMLYYDFTRYYDFSDTVFLSGCSSVTFDGNTWVSSGMYSSLNTSQVGCDSNWYYDVTLYEPDSTSEVLQGCDSALVFGIWESASGVYYKPYLNQWGCDSVHEVSLTINQSKWVVEDSISCGPIVWNGQTLNTSGQYTFAYTTAYGCDSAFLLEFTKLDADSTFQIIEACDSINWQGVVFTSDVLISEALTNANGCDSIVATQIRIGSGISFGGADSIVLCPGDLPVPLEGVSPEGGRWSGPQVYNGAFGSDSTKEGYYNIFYALQSEDGCEDSVEIVVHVVDDCDPIIWVPRAFSPNNDGTNDSWSISIRNAVSLYVAIHDRWGNRIYTSDELDFEWDGTWRDKPMPEGAYTYYLEYEYRRGKTFLTRKKLIYGTVVLLR